MVCPHTPRKLLAVVAAFGAVALSACSSDQSLGEGFLVIDGDVLLVCEALDPDTSSCLEPLAGVDSFLMLDNAVVEMGERDGIRFSIIRVELIKTDRDAAFFEAVPLESDD